MDAFLLCGLYLNLVEDLGNQVEVSTPESAVQKLARSQERKESVGMGRNEHEGITNDAWSEAQKRNLTSNFRGLELCLNC